MGTRSDLPLAWRIATALFLLVELWAMARVVAASEEPRSWMRQQFTAVLARRLGPVELGDASVDWLFRARVRDLRVRPARGGDPSPLAVADVRVRPRLLPLLGGRVELASVTLEGVQVDLARGTGELERLARRLAGDRPATGRASGADPAPGPTGPLPSLHVRDLYLRPPARPGAPDDWAGPFDLDAAARRDGASLSLSVTFDLPGGGSGAVDAARDGDRLSLRVGARVLLPADLPAGLAARLPVRPSAGELRVLADLRGDGALRTGAGTVRLEATHLSLDGRAVGPTPAGPFQGSVDLALSWSGGGARVSLDRGTITLGDGSRPDASASASVRGQLARAPADLPSLSLELRAEQVSWEALLAALPAGLRPPEAAPAVAGPISGYLRARGHPGRPGWEVEAEIDLEDLRRAARAAGPSPLASPFTWRPIDTPPGEPVRAVAVGPDNPLFVPIGELPPHLVRAVTTSEDAGFFGHRGFDFREMAVALSERGGGRLRGASTISQQLAKNLFLSGDRTLSRKVREALSTVALEASLPKTRLLEIYLNIAEWGPGVYGIGEAARFWFAKDARALTPLEAAFLASVIPSPRRFHARYHRAGISPWWSERIADILGKMQRQGHLTAEQAEEALGDSLSPLGREHPLDAGQPEPPPDEGDASDGT